MAELGLEPDSGLLNPKLEFKPLLFKYRGWKYNAVGPFPREHTTNPQDLKQPVREHQGEMGLSRFSGLVTSLAVKAQEAWESPMATTEQKEKQKRGLGSLGRVLLSPRPPGAQLAL